MQPFIYSPFRIIFQYADLTSGVSIDNYMIHSLIYIYTAKTQNFEKTRCNVDLENQIILDIFILKTRYLYLDTGSNIYLGELLVGHRASISS